MSGCTGISHYLLVEALKRYRRRAKITHADMAVIGLGSPAKWSRIENHRQRVKVADVRLACDRFQLSEAESAQLMRWAEQAGRESWSEGPMHGDSAFSTFVTLESMAVSIQAFGATVIPGLVQSLGYRQSRLAMLGIGRHEAERAEMVRAMRQRETVGRAQIDVVIDEATLHRDHGEADGMREQVKYLIDLDARSDVSIRCVPFGAGPHLGGLGEFTILRLDPRIGEPPIVYVETYFGGEYRTSHQAVADAERRFAALKSMSAPVEEFFYA